MNDLYPRDLLERLQGGGVTPFIGSGLSIPSGLPGWFDLLHGLLDELHETGVDVEQLRRLLASGQLSSTGTPELFQVLRSKYELRDYIHDRLNQPWVPNDYHTALVSLPCDVVITTNWDQLIERAFELSGTAAHKIWRDAQLAHFNPRQAVQVIKVHGTIDDIDSIVFAEDEYAHYRQEHKHLYNFLSTAVVTQTLLFLGFSCTDPNVRTLLESITNDLGGNTRRHYAVLFDSDRSEVEALARLGIRVINLPSSGDRTRVLTDWLAGLATRSRVVGLGNREKATIVNDLLERHIRSSTPGGQIRMRAALGILSNPKIADPADPIYGSAEQDVLEVEMGEKARRFLRQNPGNQIRCILHINPEHHRQNGYQGRHLRRRLQAMIEFVTEFGPQISIAHAPIQMDINQVIIGRTWSVTSFKRGESVGYDRLTVTANRWAVELDLRGFDHDFDGIRVLNQQMAQAIGIDPGATDWDTELSLRILHAAKSVAERERTVLHCDDAGNITGTGSEEETYAKGLLHRSVHLHVVDPADGIVRVLVQRRSKVTYLYGGLLDVSIASHPDQEDVVITLLQDAREHLGLELVRDDVRLHGRRQRRVDGDSEIVDVYVVKRPGLAGTNQVRIPGDANAIHWIDARNPADGYVSAIGLVRYGSLAIPSATRVAVEEFVPGAFDEISEVLKPGV